MKTMECLYSRWRGVRLECVLIKLWLLPQEIRAILRPLKRASGKLASVLFIKLDVKTWTMTLARQSLEVSTGNYPS